MTESTTLRINRQLTIRFIPALLREDARWSLIKRGRGLLALLNYMILSSVVGLTRPTPLEISSELDNLQPSESVSARRAVTQIVDTFDHSRSGNNRFNDQDFGAWYSALDVTTSIEEVAYHLDTRLSELNQEDLKELGELPKTVGYIGVLAQIRGKYHDLRSAMSSHRYLGEDKATSYPEGQRLARKLRKQGLDGIVYPSVRYSGGTCVVVFRKQLIHDIQLGPRNNITWHSPGCSEYHQVLTDE